MNGLSSIWLVCGYFLGSEASLCVVCEWLGWFVVVCGWFGWFVDDLCSLGVVSSFTANVIENISSNKT